MLRRSFLCAVILLFLCHLGRASPAAGQAPVVMPAPTTQAGWKIEVRKPGRLVWTETARSPRVDEARSLVNGLYRSGFQVRMTKYESLTYRRPTTGSVSPPASVGPSPAPAPTVPFPQPIAWASAMDVFRKLAAMGDRIAYRFPTDGCYARAHLMAQEMKQLGHQPWKVWSKANGKELLYAVTKNHPRGHVTWGWHVAPILRVKLSSGKVIWCAFDPSLQTRPCSLSEWKKVQTRPGATVSPTLEVTTPGKAPFWDGKRMGSGYTISNSIPPNRLDEVAWAKMREYKPFEGKWHPRLDKDAPTWVKSPVVAGGLQPRSPVFGGDGTSRSKSPDLRLDSLFRPIAPPKSPFPSLSVPAKPSVKSAFDVLPGLGIRR